MDTAAAPFIGTSHRHLNKLLIATFILSLALFCWWIWMLIQPARYSISADTSTQNRYIIAAIGPLTGPHAARGLPFFYFSHLIEAYINEQGGINGMPIAIIWEDGQCQPAAARSLADKLLKTYQPQAFLAGICSEEFIAAAPLAQSRKILSFSPTADSTQSASLGQYIARTGPNHNHLAQAATKILTEKSISQVTIINTLQQSSQTLTTEFQRQFGQSDSRTTNSITYEATLSAELTNSLSAQPPQAIFLIPDTIPNGIDILWQLHQANLNIPIVTTPLLANHQLAIANPQLFKSVINIEQAELPNEVATQLLEQYRQQYGRQPEYPGSMAALYQIISDIQLAAPQTNLNGRSLAENITDPPPAIAQKTSLKLDRFGQSPFTLNQTTFDPKPQSQNLFTYPQ